MQQTEAAIEEYRKANYADIVANDAKKVKTAHIRAVCMHRSHAL